MNQHFSRQPQAIEDHETSDRLSALRELLRNEQKKQAGFIPFDALMQTALYAPELGYYTATRPVGSAKSGADFTTAPEISSLFGKTLARAIVDCFDDGLPRIVLECGAGTGKLAKDVIDELNLLGVTVEQYAILELSASLRAQQQMTLAGYACVHWVDAMPKTFVGVVLANELLDALPVRSFAIEKGQVFERGVTWNQERLAWQWEQRTAKLTDSTSVLGNVSDEVKALPRYELELGSQASAWVTSMAENIERGAMILIDYGFPQAELYHPQRAGGTLMAHRLHQATPDVLAQLGDADITAHVNFSAVARAGEQGGLTLAGYLNQARFLINAGVGEAYQTASTGLDPTALAQLSRGLQLLMNESEMGELFKIVAFTKNCAAPLGFQRGDRSHRLFEEPHV